ncbi:monovalent cation:H+ antiporter, CPA1 family [Chitinophaga sp. CF118]|uniref:Na+/H+ antiporter n=1 Tax=Chitinophaga sp. CF118 TaxID=1884367 RepID=UPI0008E3C501|nr:Na+/H+ antiporter [Chitinophaga sp. CF118]SFE55425.1 monovalent cation:H+ antiporter, CPA1 family [Chitinophaga sp. CF118]
MLNNFIQYIILIIIILFLVMLAQKVKIAYPIVLVIGGLILSITHVMPVITINPELILVIFIPPLLYDAAWHTSWKDFWRWRRVISSFAFLIVIVTSFVIAFISSRIIPGFTLALGFLLGSIVSPPDAVSATSILRNVKIPRRLCAIIEGESLLNDASSLIVFRFALIAVSTGQFIFHEAAISFVEVIVMGIITGVLIGMVYYAIHRWLPTNSNMDIVLTLTAPYVMYLVAEHFHFSGVLSVVSGGLFLSFRSQTILTYRSRLRASNVWSTLDFSLNGLVFMLIGLQLPMIVDQLGTVSLQKAIGYGLFITFALIVTRILCTLGSSVFTVFISRYITTADNRPGWKGPLIFGWAGMRGVVSLAAALSIPVYMSNGEAFPQRNMILFITFMVILLTLVIQGLTLPLVIRWLNMEDPDKYTSAEEQHLHIKKKLAQHSLTFLEINYNEKLKTNPSLQQLQARFERDQSMLDPNVKSDHDDFSKIYLELLAHQRLFLRQLNKKEGVDDAVIRRYEELLDMEEEKIRPLFED